MFPYVFYIKLKFSTVGTSRYAFEMSVFIVNHRLYEMQKTKKGFEYKARGP